MRDRRGFRIRVCKRTYDRVAGKFSFNISYETHTKITPRSLVVAEAFGLGIDEAQKFKVLDAELKIGPQDIVYITGDSGSGKSVLLRAIRADLGEEAIDLNEVQVDPDKPLIETVGSRVEQGLELLSKVGLNDAFLFLRTYSQLSDGQKYRYRIAKLIESGKQWWLMDEFAACLDRDTAKIIAFNLQKIARQQGKSVIAATTHSDLHEDLKPSVLVHKRFGEEIQINYAANEPVAECSLIKEMKIEEGTREDWKKLSSFHFQGRAARANSAIFDILAKESPQTIKQLLKKITKYEGLEETYYASLTKRLRNLMETGLIEGIKPNQKGAPTCYKLCVKAILAMVLEENSMQDIFNKATNNQAAHILLAVLNVLLPEKDK